MVKLDVVISHLKRPDRSTPLAVATFSVAVIAGSLLIGLPVALVVSRHLGSPNFWFDESGQFWLSLGLHQFTPPLAPEGGWGHIVEYGRVMNTDPGTFTALLRGWIHVFGPSPVALRSLPFLFFLLTPVVIVLSALRCGANPVFAALAGSIPLGFPMLLHYATEVRAYSMETCAVVFLFFLPCWLYGQRRGWIVIMIGCSAALLVTSRYSAFLYGAAACIAALLPLRPVRTAFVRAARFSVPLIISVATGYLIFGRFQVGGTQQAPAYVAPFLLKGKDAAAQLALFRQNLIGPDALPITLFLVAAPLFYWLVPKSLIGLRSFVSSTAVFCALSVVFAVAASLAGMLPWEIHTRWSIGYQALSACCLAMMIIAAGAYFRESVGNRRWKTLFVGAGACFAVAWSMQLKAAVRAERPYYETIASHLQAVARSANAKDMTFFVQPNAAPTIRYLCEFGPLKGAFNYPGRFRFETEQEAAKPTSIPANAYDVIILTHFMFADAYRARVVGGKAELNALPPPSCLLIIRK